MLQRRQSKPTDVAMGDRELAARRHCCATAPSLGSARRSRRHNFELALPLCDNWVPCVLVLFCGYDSKKGQRFTVVMMSDVMPMKMKVHPKSDVVQPFPRKLSFSASSSKIQKKIGDHRTITHSAETLTVRHRFGCFQALIASPYYTWSSCIVGIK